MEPKADIALIGLAVMGQNLILNMNDHGFTVVAYNRTVSKVDEFLANEAKGTQGPRRALASRRWSALLKTPAPRDADGQGRQAGGRVHRAAAPAPRAGRHHHRRRQLALRGHHPPHEVRREPRACSTSAPACPAARKARGAARASCPAARPPPGRTSRTSSRPSSAKVDDGVALLRLGRRERRRPLRQDGPQRHRVRRHAADLRGLPPDEGRPRHDAPTRCTRSSPSGTRASSTAT